EVSREVVSGVRPKAVLMRTTRKLMTATKNGDMTVVAEPDRGVVASYRGEAMLSMGGGWSRLDAGHFATVTRALPKIAIKDLPQAPRLQLSQRLWMSLHEPAQVGGFRWSKAAGDARFQISVRPLKESPLAASTTLPLTRVLQGTRLPDDALAL